MNGTSDYRFRNSATDMRDCEDVIDQLLNGVTDDGRPLPQEELRAAGQLIACCIDIVNLVADEAQVNVDFNAVKVSLEAVLRAANDAPLKARYDSRAENVLLSKAVK